MLVYFLMQPAKVPIHIPLSRAPTEEETRHEPKAEQGLQLVSAQTWSEN